MIFNFNDVLFRSANVSHLSSNSRDILPRICDARHATGCRTELANLHIIRLDHDWSTAYPFIVNYAVTAHNHSHCTHFWKKWTIVELLLLTRFVRGRFGIGCCDMFSFQIAGSHTFPQVGHHNCLFTVNANRNRVPPHICQVYANDVPSNGVEKKEENRK